MQTFKGFGFRYYSQDIQKERDFLTESGFNKSFESDLSIMQTCSSFFLEITSKQAELPELILQFEDTDKAIDLLYDLGIQCDFIAEGEDFEAVFHTPEGLKVILSEKLTDCTGKDIEIYELAVPTDHFIDSVNFWTALGFTPLNDPPRNHPWCRLQLKNLIIGIHSSAYLREKEILIQGLESTILTPGGLKLRLWNQA